MYAQQGQQSQSPHSAQPQWEAGPPHAQQYQHPPPGAYPPPPPGQQQPGQYQQQPHQQPMNIRPDRPEMAAIQPQYGQQPPMFLPSPSAFYGPPPHDYRPPPTQSSNQSAPRQRTAIACKYCRRRKIRCSGFENSEDGRCTNCNRFNQECVFTPVSAQTQAFVPAQAVYGARRPPPNQPLYGSYGQPLRGEAYPQPQPYSLPHPSHPYPPPGQPYGQPPYMHQTPYTMHSPSGGPRPGEDPHAPSLPPPNQGGEPRRDGAPSSYAYPDQSAYANGVPSPASTAPSYHGMPAQGYYGAPPQPRRDSPGSSYPGYEQPGSTSPHGQSGYYTHPGAMQHAATGSHSNGHTPPHSGPGAPEGKNGMSISNIVSDGAGNGERTAADSDMVSALNRTSRR